MIQTQVYAVPLWANKGFAFVEIFQNPLFGYQVRALSHFSKDLIKIEELQPWNKKELCPRLLLNGMPRTRKYKDKLIWSLLGESKIDEKVAFEVKFKKGAGHFTENNIDWSLNPFWSVVENWDLKNQVENQDYNVVKNMPLWIHPNYIGLTIILDMYWLKAKDINILDFYGDIIKSSVSHRFAYHIVENIPLY